MGRATSNGNEAKMNDTTLTCPNQNFNSGGSDLWPTVLPVRPWRCPPQTVISYSTYYAFRVGRFNPPHPLGKTWVGLNSHFGLN